MADYTDDDLKRFAPNDELLPLVLGEKRTRELMDAIQRLETLASVRELRPLLSA